MSNDYEQPSVLFGRYPKEDHAFCTYCHTEFFLDEAKSIYFCNSQCAEMYTILKGDRINEALKSTDTGSSWVDWL
jgi:hypothetical protein